MWKMTDISALQETMADQIVELKAERDALKAQGMWTCNACGPHVKSRANWCERGCGSDYNRMEFVRDGDVYENVRVELAKSRAENARLRAKIEEAVVLLNRGLNHSAMLRWESFDVTKAREVRAILEGAPQ
jgi:hypothetical protein